MAAFSDQKKREWTIRICGPSIDLVREVDPLFLLDDDGRDRNTIDRLTGDPGLFCHVIYTLCKKERESRDVGFDEFYEQVIGDGDTIAAAGEALASAIENFTRPGKREYMKAVDNKRKAAEALAMTKGLARMNDPAFDAKIEKAIDEAFDKAFARLGNVTDSPVSSASPPTG